MYIPNKPQNTVPKLFITKEEQLWIHGKNMDPTIVDQSLSVHVCSRV